MTRFAGNLRKTPVNWLRKRPVSRAMSGRFSRLSDGRVGFPKRPESGNLCRLDKCRNEIKVQTVMKEFLRRVVPRSQ